MRLLLSASVPDDGERGLAAAPFSAPDITSATSALVRATLHAGHTLVFGGHPAITPFVLHAAAENDARDQVVIYQSRWFADRLTDATRQLVERGYARLEWVDAGPDLPRSLDLLRDRMLSERLDGAAFIGGMDGILDEFERFTRSRSGRPRFLYVTPGGYAAQLGADTTTRLTGDTPDFTAAVRRAPGPVALIGRDYHALATRLLDALSDATGTTPTDPRGGPPPASATA